LQCENCGAQIELRRPWKRFCSDRCRAEANWRRGAGAIGAAASVRKIKRGAVSLTIHFDGEEAKRALKCAIGERYQVVRAGKLK
jgi:hypothetical protein